MKYKVIEAYTSAYPDPISFKAGEELTTGRLDDEYPGWIRITTQCGNEGWAPVQYINATVKPALGLCDYEATELTTQTDLVLSVMKTLNEWAWAETPQGEKGWVPLSTLAALE
ncbi:SH3 domain-containing protein [Parendozoicomonas haliclonae]|uniref:Variant SH3 domain protein n=1 Tax=Parendozoicomonas haliclonae TaxID=1960125 RepID=A0A1X7AH34_9GAMM|nr:SH3 domain-containing protein [Parendozoicomonas haliclonae]SMA34795.1 Variant SH3 domain protein [Parendozoicomonas haliclonae]